MNCKGCLYEATIDGSKHCAAPTCPRASKKFKCAKGHVHSTEQQALNCYICKRRGKRRKPQSLA